MEKSANFSIKKWLVVGLMPLALWTLICGLFGWLAWSIGPWWLFFPCSIYAVGVTSYFGGVKGWQVYQRSKARHARLLLEQHKLRIANFFSPASAEWEEEMALNRPVAEQANGDQG
ncbi:MAG: DUF3267 domain-containing protein [SAR202 cluster bacterium]|nr:DUF3267 domain-containing protein [SAR202 cluster bacterium]